MFRRRTQSRILSRPGQKNSLQSQRHGKTLILSSPSSFTAYGSRESSEHEFRNEPLFRDEYLLPAEERQPIKSTARPHTSHPRQQKSLPHPHAAQTGCETGSAKAEDYEVFEIGTTRSIVLYNPGKARLVDVLPRGSKDNSFLIQSSTSSDSDVRLSGFYRSRSASLETGSSTSENIPETPLTTMSTYSQRPAFTATFKKDMSVVYRRIDQMSPTKVALCRNDYTHEQHQSWFAYDDRGTEVSPGVSKDERFAYAL